MILTGAGLRCVLFSSLTASLANAASITFTVKGHVTMSVIAGAGKTVEVTNDDANWYGTAGGPLVYPISTRVRFTNSTGGALANVCLAGWYLA